MRSRTPSERINDGDAGTCVVCEKVVRARPARGGDGTVRVAVPHGGCEGAGRPVREWDFT